MFSTILAYLTNTAVVGAAAFVAGVILSQKVKDWAAGVPSELRRALNDVEKKAKADIADAVTGVLDQLPKLAAKEPVTVAVTAPEPAPAPAPEPSKQELPAPNNQ